MEKLYLQLKETRIPESEVAIIPPRLFIAEEYPINFDCSFLSKKKASNPVDKGIINPTPTPKRILNAKSI